jgi:uncharacterized protein
LNDETYGLEAWEADARRAGAPARRGVTSEPKVSGAWRETFLAGPASSRLSSASPSTRTLVGLSGIGFTLILKLRADWAHNSLQGEKMNEQANTRLVQQAYQSIAAGDIQALLNSFAEDIAWELPEMENVPFAGKWQGHQGVRQFFSKVFEVQDVVEFEPEEFVAQGDKVVALGNFLMRVKATRGEYSSKWAQVWTVKDGKVTRFSEYVDTAVVSRTHTAAKTV